MKLIVNWDLYDTTFRTLKLSQISSVNVKIILVEFVLMVSLLFTQGSLIYVVDSLYLIIVKLFNLLGISYIFNILLTSNFYLIGLVWRLLLLNFEELRLSGGQQLCLFIPLQVLFLLILWSNILLFLCLKREWLKQVTTLQILHLLLGFLNSLSSMALLWVMFGVPEGVDPIVLFELVVVFVFVAFTAELLPIDLVQHMRDYLDIKIFISGQLENLLAVAVKYTKEHVNVAKAWELYSLLEKAPLPFGHSAPSFELIFNRG